MDAAILFSDILMVPYGMGQRLDYVEGEGPLLERIANGHDLARLSLTGVNDRLVPVFETVRRVKSELTDNVALIGFAGSPWTVACYMVQGSGSKDWDRVKQFGYSDPIGFSALIDALIAVTTDYLFGQIAAGVDAIQLFDSWAGVLAPRGFKNWVIEPTRRVVEAVKQRYPEVPIIGFPRGGGLMSEAYFLGTGVDAIGLDTTVPPNWAAQHLQKHRPVQGNLDPMLLVVGGEAMAQGVDDVLGALTGGPFVFNLGHGVLQGTPPEHVMVLSELIRTWPERRQRVAAGDGQ
jgi:uroporphyrinogen decarboxylase